MLEDHADIRIEDHAVLHNNVTGVIMSPIVNDILNLISKYVV